MTNRPVAAAKSARGTIGGVTRNVTMAQALSGTAVSDAAIKASLKRHGLLDTSANVVAVRAASGRRADDVYT